MTSGLFDIHSVGVMNFPLRLLRNVRLRWLQNFVVMIVNIDLDTYVDEIQRGVAIINNTGPQHE